MRDNILQEIRDTVKARVKNTGHTLVIDSAAETVNGTPIVLFTAGTDDITETVLSQLNINAPPPTAAKPDAKPDKGAKSVAIGEFEFGFWLGLRSETREPEIRF